MDTYLEHKHLIINTLKKKTSSGRDSCCHFSFASSFRAAEIRVFTSLCYQEANLYLLGVLSKLVRYQISRCVCLRAIEVIDNEAEENVAMTFDDGNSVIFSSFFCIKNTAFYFHLMNWYNTLELFSGIRMYKNRIMFVIAIDT